jgi:hypothetical protein
MGQADTCAQTYIIYIHIHIKPEQRSGVTLEFAGPCTRASGGRRVEGIDQKGKRKPPRAYVRVCARVCLARNHPRATKQVRI